MTIAIIQQRPSGNISNAENVVVKWAPGAQRRGRIQGEIRGEVALKP
jgi:hypothetical protein